MQNLRSVQRDKGFKLARDSSGLCVDKHRGNVSPLTCLSLAVAFQMFYFAMECLVCSKLVDLRLRCLQTQCRNTSLQTGSKRSIQLRSRISGSLSRKIGTAKDRLLKSFDLSLVSRSKRAESLESFLWNEFRKIPGSSRCFDTLEMLCHDGSLLPLTTLYLPHRQQSRKAVMLTLDSSMFPPLYRTFETNKSTQSSSL